MGIEDYAIIIGFTTILTTASTTIIIYNAKETLKKDICDQIQELFVKVGILEAKHNHD